MSASNFYDEVCGVIGGVGPEATTFLFRLIVKLHPAKIDQEHIPLLIFNNPQIPDRTKALLNTGPDSTDELIHTGNVLKKAGATFLAMPCNTAHAFLERLEKGVGIHVLNMLGLTAEAITKDYGDDIKVGLMATDGTIKTEIYKKEFVKVSQNIKLLYPLERDQKEIMDVIFGEKGIKAGYADDRENFLRLEHAANALMERGAKVIILGCTELPLVFALHKSSANLIDPMEVLAKNILKKTLASKHE